MSVEVQTDSYGSGGVRDRDEGVVPAHESRARAPRSRPTSAMPSAPCTESGRSAAWRPAAAAASPSRRGGSGSAERDCSKQRAVVHPHEPLPIAVLEGANARATPGRAPSRRSCPSICPASSEEYPSRPGQDDRGSLLPIERRQRIDDVTPHVDLREGVLRRRDRDGSLHREGRPPRPTYGTRSSRF